MVFLRLELAWGRWAGSELSAIKAGDSMRSTIARRQKLRMRVPRRDPESQEYLGMELKVRQNLALRRIRVLHPPEGHFRPVSQLDGRLNPSRNYRQFRPL